MTASTDAGGDAPAADARPDVTPDVIPDVTPDARPDAPACVASSEQPVPRADAVGAVDPASGRLYVFGGDTGRVVSCTPAPAFSDETWRYDPSCDRWDPIAADAHPSARSRAAWAFDARRGRLVVLGGRFRAGASGNYTLLRDVWAFDVAAERWEEITPEAPGPTGRANATAVYDAASDAVVLFGGNTSASGTAFSPRNDAWALDLATRAWRRIETTGEAPVPRLFHAATMAGGAMLVFGGGGANAFTGPFYRDAWRLDLAAAAWSQVALSGATDDLAGRISASLVPTQASGDVLLVGGHDDGALGNRNDVLAVAPDGAVRVIGAGDSLQTPGRGFCDFPADFATNDPDSPERRSAFVLAPDPARGRALVYGGKTDCGLAGDVWSLDLATGAWRTLRGATDGLSCQRSGRSNCRTLCN